MGRLHFKKFLMDFNEHFDESLLEKLEICLKENETDCLERGSSLVEQYENYSQKTINHFHNILRLFDVLPNFLFTTSETMHDYYL